jgi:hypothetical protein
MTSWKSEARPGGPGPAIGIVRYATNMSQRKEWQKVLDSEVKRWSAMSCGQLVSELHEVQGYEVEFESKRYQVEVELLENTEKYLHVMVAVDDGSLPGSISPLTHSFVCQKPTV